MDSTSKTKCLNAFNRYSASILSKIEQYEGQSHKYSDSSSEWSPLEIFHHLFLTQSASLKYLKYKENTFSTAKHTNIATWVRFQLLKQKLNSTTNKYDAPESVNPIKQQPLDLEEIKRSLMSNIDTFAVYLNSLDKQFFNKAIYKHPAIGYISLTQMVEFMDLHMLRHIRQLERQRVKP
jgi:hypothetical protein